MTDTPGRQAPRLIDITDDQKGRWREPLFRAGALPVLSAAGLFIGFLALIVAERDIGIAFGAVCIAVLIFLNIRHRIRHGSWPS